MNRPHVDFPEPGRSLRLARVLDGTAYAALKEGKTGSASLELLVENSDYFHTYQLDYHGGEKYPRLVRDESKPDVLSEIIKAK